MHLSFLSAPSAPPRNITIEANDSATITVEWKGVECIERNGEITGYIVHYSPTDANINCNTTSVPGNGHRGGTVTLTGLSAITNYSVEVAANGSSGPGPFSFPQFVVTLADSE